MASRSYWRCYSNPVQSFGRSMRLPKTPVYRFISSMKSFFHIGVVMFWAELKLNQRLDHYSDVQPGKKLHWHRTDEFLVAAGDFSLSLQTP